MIAFLLLFIICTPTVLTEDPRSSLEHYCYVESPIDSASFNLTTIQHDHSDSRIRINENEYLRVHFCQPLKEPCNGKQDYAVCLHVNGSQEIGVGKEPPVVTFEFGKIMFKYTGDKCNETHFYTVDIDMKCNYAMMEKIAADLDVTYNRDQCGFEMTIETATACALRKQTKCELKHKSGYYDVSPLVNLERNYEVQINESLSVILNICHSLIYGEHYNTCDHDTMVCLIDATDRNIIKYRRLGIINDEVRFSIAKGNLHMDMTSDTPCEEETSIVRKTIRTTIELVCNENATNELPKYISGYGTCHYKFEWKSRAACNEATLTRLSQVNHQPCRIRDPMYQLMFDMSMLEGKLFKINSINPNIEYHISICSPLKISDCSGKPGIGVCKYYKDKKEGVSVGLSNDDLKWYRGAIFLNYTDGVACGNNQRMYTTVLFQCGPEESILVYDNDPCETKIVWTTPMVCNRKCATADYEINLERLGRMFGNYVAQGETNLTHYHINICQPLFHEGFTNCINGVGICKVVSKNSGKRLSELSLGVPEFGLSKAEDGRLFIRFLNGSDCEDDPGRRITSEISFTCDVAISAIEGILKTLSNDPSLTRMWINSFERLFRGRPVFKGYDDCKYNFTWKTSLSCNIKESLQAKADCGLTNKIEKYNLSNIQLKKNGSIGFFNITMCGEKKQCSGTFVCDNHRNYGKDIEVATNYSQNIVLFKFENETKCQNNGHYHEVLNIWCNVWAGIGEPLLLNEGECSVILDQPTNPVCKKHKGRERDVETGHMAEVLQIIMLIVAAIIVMLLCLYYRYGGRRTLEFFRNQRDRFTVHFSARERVPEIRDSARNSREIQPE